MSEYQNWDKELDRLEAGESQYSWDELEELITDRLEDDKIDEQEFADLGVKPELCGEHPPRRRNPDPCSQQ